MKRQEAARSVSRVAGREQRAQRTRMASHSTSCTEAVQEAIPTQPNTSIRARARQVNMPETSMRERVKNVLKPKSPAKTRVQMSMPKSRGERVKGSKRMLNVVKRGMVLIYSVMRKTSTLTSA